MTFHNDLRAHAIAEYPRECCGLVVRVDADDIRYVRCVNAAVKPQQHFIIAKESYVECAELGEIIAVGHSHPGELTAVASPADLVQCETWEMPWFIVPVHLPENAVEPVTGDICAIEPSGYVQPLVGRPFSHGVLDCYSLIRDWYKQKRGIVLQNYERDDEWWLRGENLYMEQYEDAGFTPLTKNETPDVGDVIIMQVRSKVPNHAGVYIGHGQILHHVARRMSTRDIYDGYWQEVTRLIVRYRK